MTDDKLIQTLEAKAKLVRREIIEMIYQAGSGHPGGSLSAADLVTVLFFHVLRHDPSRPLWADRDRFILSKGHCAPLLYAVLAESGYFPKEELKTLRKIGSCLQGHPDMRKTPGVEVSTGSLGQGLSVANGIALGGRMDRKDYTVYVLLGDGEINEGQVWEAAMLASHYKLDNVIAVLDYNGLQVDGPTCRIMDLEPVSDKWKAFGWWVMEIDGHDVLKIIEAFKKAKKNTGKPAIIIAHTVKGKGISFMENKVDWHGKVPNEEEFHQAMRELSN